MIPDIIDGVQIKDCGLITVDCQGGLTYDTHKFILTRDDLKSYVEIDPLLIKEYRGTSDEYIRMELMEHIRSINTEIKNN